MADSFTFHILPTEVADAPFVSKIGSDAFLVDRQTQMKNIGRKPYDLASIGHDHTLLMLSLPEKCQLIKAVDSKSGEIIGFCNWIYRSCTKEEVANFAGYTDADLQRQERVKQEALIAIEERKRLAAEAKEKEDLGEMSWGDYTSTESNKDDPIVRLEALTGADMDKWSAILQPPNTKCICVGGFSVKPDFQRRGVGRALISVMGKIADNANIHCWVHSSEIGWQGYMGGGGFEIVGTLDVDLDDFAPAPPPDWYECEDKGKWGHYIFRYMKRNPVKVES